LTPSTRDTEGRSGARHADNRTVSAQGNNEISCAADDREKILIPPVSYGHIDVLPGEFVAEPRGLF